VALAYVARFATTAAKLEAILAQIRERGWNDDNVVKNVETRHDLSVKFPADSSNKAILTTQLCAFPQRRRDATLALARAGLTQDLYAGIDEQIRADVAPGGATIRRRHAGDGA
jgi:hypothetical protein